MHTLAQKEDIDIEIDSAGTYGGHVGSLPHPQMRKAGEKRGHRMTHRARQFTPEDFNRFDMILTMDEQNYATVSRMGTKEQLRKLYRMGDFAEVHEIPDPYGYGDEAFEYVLDLLEKGCVKLLEHIR